MANNFNFQPINSQPQQLQQMQPAQLMQQNSILFPQPIGSVYNLNTASDIDGIVYDIFNPSDRIVWEVYKVK